MKIPSEHDEQKALVKKLRGLGVVVFAIPNGGLRDKVTSTRLKEEGAVSGIPDLLIVLDDGKSLWVEMKRREGGKLSDAQIQVISKFAYLGHRVVVGYGAKDAFEKIKPHLGLT